MTYNELIREIREGRLNYYNIYNAISTHTYLTTKYYNEFTHDTIDKPQKVSVLYLDIEVYIPSKNRSPDPQKDPICAFSIVYERNAYLFGLIPPGKAREELPSKEELEELVARHVGKKYSIEVRYYDNDADLLKGVWRKIRELDPCLLSGWNIDGFDIPYIIERMQVLLPNEWQRVISRFGRVTKEQGYWQIPEYSRYDLYYFYKPRDEGGMNYGSKEPSYTLDFIASKLLNVTKVHHETDLHTMFEEKTRELFVYNVVDTILCQMLDEKLKFWDLHNTVRRKMGVGFSASLRGWSVMYEAYVIKTLKDKKIRFGYLEELDFEVDQYSKQDVRKVTRRYMGAYVKEPREGIYIDGLLMDLDASRLYPSMIMQFNISFDTLYGIIIDPVCYNAMTSLSQMMNSTGERRQQIAAKIKLAIEKTFEQIFGTTSKGKTSYRKEDRAFLTVISAIVDRLCESGLSFQEICTPTTPKGYVYLRRYFIPLLDMIKYVKYSTLEYNTFAYDYVFDEPKVNSVYVLINCDSKPLKIDKWSVEYLKKRLDEDLVLTCTGCLFYKHDVKRGLFFEFLQELGKMRKDFERKALQVDDEELKNIYRRNAKTCKVIMNTCYGLYGLPTFTFSNQWLASTITLQGRISVKLAQLIADQVISEL